MYRCKKPKERQKKPHHVARLSLILTFIHHQNRQGLRIHQNRRGERDTLPDCAIHRLAWVTGLEPAYDKVLETSARPTQLYPYF